MNDEIIIFVKRDENNSIVAIRSNFHITVFEGWEKVDEWKEGQDRYLYDHADNGEYVLNKHGKPLFDKNGIPNFHDDFVEWTEEEKNTLYPELETLPTEQDLINADIYMQLATLQISNNITTVMSANSPRYEILKKYYDMGIYTKEDMRLFVECRWLTEAEYKEIIKDK